MGLDENEFGMGIEQFEIEAVAAKYLDKYGEQGVVDMVWDDKEECWGYRDLGGEWRYVREETDTGEAGGGADGVNGRETG